MTENSGPIRLEEFEKSNEKGRDCTYLMVKVWACRERMENV